ncbi:MAG: SgcJ/EcaC family oxidoreductase [Alphaproteobacteria bacterium]|nr:SgcJ/EcaC family oxidoreductase [Alphaproteobacteria bacterium]
MTARSAIEVVGAAFCELYNSGNAAGLAGLYTEDAALMPPDAPRLEGREAIQQYWQGLIDAGVGDVSLNTFEVEEAGDSAVEMGALTATVPGEGDVRVTVAGKYVVLWRHDGDGSWRLHRDIWNFDA